MVAQGRVHVHKAFLTLLNDDNHSLHESDQQQEDMFLQSAQ